MMEVCNFSVIQITKLLQTSSTSKAGLIDIDSLRYFQLLVVDNLLPDHVGLPHVLNISVNPILMGLIGRADHSETFSPLALVKGGLELGLDNIK